MGRSLGGQPQREKVRYGTSVIPCRHDAAESATRKIMDKLRAMQFFCRTVEAGSFAAAAQALQVVPSVVSKGVAALEHELGFPLMNRSTRGFSLTEEGSAYHQQCRQILQEIEEAEALGSPGATPRGILRIGMHPGLRFPVLGQLGIFMHRHAGLSVETVITNSPSAVVSEGLDVVLHIGMLPDSSLVARPLGMTRTVVCASPAYLQARGEPLHPRDLAGHAAVIFARRDEEPNTRWAFRRGAERVEVDVAARAVSRDGIGLVDAALGGCGIARPFEVSIRHWLATKQLRPLLEDWEGDTHAITAVLPSRSRGASAKVALCLDFIGALLRQGTPDQGHRSAGT
jgi:LysR family transcriptional regulator, transcriptional activator for dmlA